MSIRVVSHIEDGLGTIRKTVEFDRAEDWKDFQELVQRAANLWPDAKPQMKKFADVVTNGKVMQDYGPDA